MLSDPDVWTGDQWVRHVTVVVVGWLAALVVATVVLVEFGDVVFL